MIAYIQQIAFIVYRAVRTVCLYKADSVYYLQRRPDWLLKYSRFRVMFTAR